MDPISSKNRRGIKSKRARVYKPPWFDDQLIQGMDVPLGAKW